MVLGEGARAALVGILAAIVVCTLAALLPAHQGVELMAGILIAAALVYPGAALGRREWTELRVELSAAGAFFALAVVGLWWSPRWIGLGLLIHAAWDAAHHPRRLGTDVGSWFPPFCCAADVILALFVLLKYS
jgi:hypothetical protein